MPTILVTGGAGYIGSHTAHFLAQQNYKVIILDLSTSSTSPGRCRSFSSSTTFIQGDIADTALLHTIFTVHNISAVMHFAASIEVGESVKNPLPFYANNVTNTLSLLTVMLEHGVKNFIFSSSCAVYGTPQHLPLTEDHPKNPISPYGKTKLVIEMALEDLSRAYGLNYVALRYFNAAGASPEHNLGERHTPETHLIPLLLASAQSQTPFNVFGADYPTPDGTAIRDFVHVQDIATAHVLALKYLQNGGKSDAFNLGTGIGASVKEMIAVVETVTQKGVPVVFQVRREGDPAVLVAKAETAREILGWEARWSSLEEIVGSANEFYLAGIAKKP